MVPLYAEVGKLHRRTNTLYIFLLIWASLDLSQVIGDTGELQLAVVEASSATARGMGAGGGTTGESHLRDHRELHHVGGIGGVIRAAGAHLQYM